MEKDLPVARPGDGSSAARQHTSGRIKDQPESVLVALMHALFGARVLLGGDSAHRSSCPGNDSASTLSWVGTGGGRGCYRVKANAF